MLDVVSSMFVLYTEFVPAGYVEANGQLHNVADYPELASILKNRFGGDGITTFRVPDHRPFPPGAKFVICATGKMPMP